MLYCEAGTVAKPRLTRLFKEFLGVALESSAIKVQIKPFETTQNITWMTGYVFKDRNCPHFESHTKGDLFTPDFIEQGCQGHEVNCVNYTKNKTCLTRANLFKLAYAFEVKNLQGLDCSLARTIQYMIQSDRYTLATNFLTIGHPIDTQHHIV